MYKDIHPFNKIVSVKDIIANYKHVFYSRFLDFFFILHDQNSIPIGK